jgi:hypothetical protein
MFALQSRQERYLQTSVSLCVLVVLTEAYRSGGCVKPVVGNSLHGPCFGIRTLNP